MRPCCKALKFFSFDFGVQHDILLTCWMRFILIVLMHYHDYFFLTLRFANSPQVVCGRWYHWDPEFRVSPYSTSNLSIGCSGLFSSRLCWGLKLWRWKWVRSLNGCSFDRPGEKFRCSPSLCRNGCPPADRGLWVSANNRGFAARARQPAHTAVWTSTDAVSAGVQGWIEFGWWEEEFI